jgi:uncharacterized tellurite resistance protein B-like protein
MLDRILNFLKELPSGESNRRKLSADDPRIAAAALMYHVMDADGVRQDAEWERLKQALTETFGVTGAALDELIAAGSAADEEAIDLYAFTSVLKRHLEPEQRVEFIGLMWNIAYADGQLDELEDNTLWRVADLLGVDSRDRVLERQRAKAGAQKPGASRRNDRT